MASARERDDGLRRVSRATRWVAAGAFGAAGLLSVAAAKAVPGRSTRRLPAGQGASVTGGENPGATYPGASAPGATDPNAVDNPGATDPNATAPNLTPLAPPPIQLAPASGRGSIVSGGS